MPEPGLSRTLALAWGLAAAPQRGPKRELSLERIVDAAIAIADAEGLAAVTMQRVAQTFDFSTMALYRYVATKDELHHLMLDTAMGASIFAVAKTGDWREELAEFTEQLVAGYRAHPWALDIPLAPDIHMMPGQIRAAEEGLRIMSELPISSDAKLAVLSLLAAFARGQAGVEREVLAGIVTPPETRALLEEAVSPARFPQVAALVRNGIYFGDPPAGNAVPDAAGAVSAASPAAVPSGNAPAPAASAAPAGEAAASGGADPSAAAGELLRFSIQVLVAGLAATLSEMPPPSPADAAPPATPPTPQQTYEAAELALREHIALRKRTQHRVRDLERQEAALYKARDRAKEFAKAHAKQSRP